MAKKTQDTDCPETTHLSEDLYNAEMREKLLMTDEVP